MATITRLQNAVTGIINDLKTIKHFTKDGYLYDLTGSDRTPSTVNGFTQILTAVGYLNADGTVSDKWEVGDYRKIRYEYKGQTREAVIHKAGDTLNDAFIMGLGTGGTPLSAPTEYDFRYHIGQEDQTVVDEPIQDLRTNDEPAVIVFQSAFTPSGSDWDITQPLYPTFSLKYSSASDTITWADEGGNPPQVLYSAGAWQVSTPFAIYPFSAVHIVGTIDQSIDAIWSGKAVDRNTIDGDYGIRSKGVNSMEGQLEVLNDIILVGTGKSTITSPASANRYATEAQVIASAGNAQVTKTDGGIFQETLLPDGTRPIEQWLNDLYKFNQLVKDLPPWIAKASDNLLKKLDDGTMGPQTKNTTAAGGTSYFIHNAGQGFIYVRDNGKTIGSQTGFSQWNVTIQPAIPGQAAPPGAQTGIVASGNWDVGSTTPAAEVVIDLAALGWPEHWSDPIKVGMSIPNNTAADFALANRIEFWDQPIYRGGLYAGITVSPQAGNIIQMLQGAQPGIDTIQIKPLSTSWSSRTLSQKSADYMDKINYKVVHGGPPTIYDEKRQSLYFVVSEGGVEVNRSPTFSFVGYNTTAWSGEWSWKPTNYSKFNTYTITMFYRIDSGNVGQALDFGAWIQFFGYEGLYATLPFDANTSSDKKYLAGQNGTYSWDTINAVPSTAARNATYSKIDGLYTPNKPVARDLQLNAPTIFGDIRTEINADFGMGNIMVAYQGNASVDASQFTSAKHPATGDYLYLMNISNQASATLRIVLVSHLGQIWMYEGLYNGVFTNDWVEVGSKLPAFPAPAATDQKYALELTVPTSGDPTLAWQEIRSA